jgi:hypothetical protein
MSGYVSGVAALTDGRLRLSGLPPDQGILLLEGRDDVRLLAPILLGLDAVIPCGNKPKLLQAFHALRSGEDRRFVFVADCDYDVPLGRLAPAENLILTSGVDVEADLISLGLTERIVTELVPEAINSDTGLRETTRIVEERAMAIADAVGRFRRLSAERGLGLSFATLRYRRHRTAGSNDVDLAKLARTLRQTNPMCGLDARELETLARALPVANNGAHGDDLLGGIEAVLRDDLRVTPPSVETLVRLLRASATTETFEQWDVYRRLRAWEARTGRRILR